VHFVLSFGIQRAEAPLAPVAAIKSLPGPTKATYSTKPTTIREVSFTRKCYVYIAAFQEYSLEGIGMAVEKSKEADAKRAEASFKKEERAREGKQGAAAYEAEGRAVAAKTARLKALRLAKEAADNVEEAANLLKTPTAKKQKVRRPIP
jgi:hypothetical protein